jgi:hypothetical protein
MVIRRAHLYAGLLMLPWVLLYGVTGLLFNHPTWFPDTTILRFGPPETKGTDLERLPTPSEIASEVVQLANARSGGGFRLVRPEDARFDRGGIGATVAVGKDSYTVSLDPAEGTGQIRLLSAAQAAQAAAQAAAQNGGRPQGGPGAAGGRGEGVARGGPGAEAKAEGSRGGPAAESGRGEQGSAGRGSRGGGAPEATDPLSKLGRLELASKPLEKLEQGLPRVLERSGLEGAKVSQVRASALSFLVEAGDSLWRASYNLQTGLISARPERESASAAAADLSTRRFLLRLHTAHGYPDEFGARYVWAILVDAMSMLMIFWGISGIVMWWQIKRTRKLGSAALLFSALLASWACVQMHSAMLTGGR